MECFSGTSVHEKELEENPANREVQLLYGSEDRLGIYQLKDTGEARDIHFMNIDYLESKEIAVTKENYDLIYTAPLEEGTSLKDIYTRFNIDRPADFRGHSLSVSDVVVLHQNGENTSYYVDSFGYREVPEFAKELMAEHTKEQAPVIDEAKEILSEIAQEHAQDEPDREMKCSLSITMNGVRSVCLTWHRITLQLTIRMQTGITDFCICRTRLRTSHLQECIMILMRKLRMPSMKQSVNGKYAFQ